LSDDIEVLEIKTNPGKKKFNFDNRQSLMGVFVMAFSVAIFEPENAAKGYFRIRSVSRGTRLR
jgi:hypothetical protein